MVVYRWRGVEECGGEIGVVCFSVGGVGKEA